MACFYPLKGWLKKGSENGKRAITFTRADAYVDVDMTVPCGQCIGCRLERSRQWAVRIMHEASLHDENAFITLTYSPEHLPEYGSLRKRDFQLFMKRLRKEIAPQKVRYFHCGEYGEKFSRPHYHAIIFGYGFPDRYYHAMRNGRPVFRSPTLERLWPYGFSEIGSVTFESAAYVARYILKKVNGDMAEEHYSVADAETGEVVMLEAEYCTMSRRPGIGRGWFEQFQDEVYPSDEVIVRGRQQKPPKYYDKILEQVDPELAGRVREERRKARQVWTEQRLNAGREITEARVGLFQKRRLENGETFGD